MINGWINMQITWVGKNEEATIILAARVKKSANKERWREDAPARVPRANVFGRVIAEKSAHVRTRMEKGKTQA